MLQLKRFFVLIYAHLTLSIMLIYLTTIVSMTFSFIKEDGMKALFGVGCTSVIFLIIGLFWGIITPHKKKLLLPLGIYVLILLLFYAVGLIFPHYWIIFLNANLPYTVFIRNITTRTLLINLIHGLGCLIPSLVLYEAFNVSFHFSHRNTKLTDPN